jgi:hypothetical protein
MKYITATIRNTERNRQVQILFWALATTIILLAVMYMYFVNKTVWNVVQRQHIESNIASLNSKLSETEFQYINSVSGITMETAQRMGFVSAADHTTFVAREEIGKNVAIR